MLNLRIAALVLVCSLGGGLFGFDTGVIGGITTMKSFQRDFGLTEENASQLSGNVASILQAGCFFGVILMTIVTDKLGRKTAMMACGALFDLGAVLQCASKNKIALFYVGRVVSGLGVGAASLITPLFISEMSPKKYRGAMLTSFNTSIYTGVAIAYWVDYACQQTISEDKTAQWLVPISLQLVFGTALAVGVIPLPESVRWLVRTGKKAKALKNLKYLRNGAEESEILEEFAEICESVEFELEITEGVSWREIFMKGNRYRTCFTLAIMIEQQLTGTNAFTIWAPILFKAVGLSAESAGLLATGVYGIVKIVFSVVGMLFVVDRFGRKLSLLVGGFGMACMLLIVAILLAKFPQDPESSTVSSPSIAMLVMFYLYGVFYSLSWGPVPWDIIAEIAAPRLREINTAIGACTQWAFNLMISKVVPIAVENIGWRMFLMFAIFNYAGIAFTWFFVKETKGLSLEEMDALFGAATAIDVNEAHERAGAIAANVEEEDLKAHTSHQSRA